jgi:hypothetical protein
MNSAERSHITNGIWLCQTHAKLIDDDCVRWTQRILIETKARHEEHVARTIGMPLLHPYKGQRVGSLTPREYAFVHVRALSVAYKGLVLPILEDRGLPDDSELGILICGDALEGGVIQHGEPPWTVFVQAAWLRWTLQGQTLGVEPPTQVPPEQVYGQIPAWPDSFFELLAAIVETNMTFEWQRHPDGYLVLSQHGSR